jgi:hypothetical protein
MARKFPPPLSVEEQDLTIKRDTVGELHQLECCCKLLFLQLSRDPLVRLDCAQFVTILNDGVHGLVVCVQDLRIIIGKCVQIPLGHAVPMGVPTSAFG